MEVTITMLLAAILIGITYTTYTIISKSYLSFTRKNDDMAVVLLVDKLLKKDFSHAEIVLKDSSGVSFKGANRIIKYKFSPDYIVRISGRLDTFKVQTEVIKTAFEQQPAAEFSVIDEESRIDDLELTILLQNEKIPYHYHKQYSSFNLIQRNPDALN
jgi:hypothetical protein